MQFSSCSLFRVSNCGDLFCGPYCPASELYSRLPYKRASLATVEKQYRFFVSELALRLAVLLLLVFFNAYQPNLPYRWTKWACSLLTAVHSPPLKHVSSRDLRGSTLKKRFGWVAFIRVINRSPSLGPTNKWSEPSLLSAPAPRHDL